MFTAGCFRRISNNRFEGTVPKELEKLPGLEILFVDDNQFTGFMINHTASQFDIAPLDFIADPEEENSLVAIIAAIVPIALVAILSAIIYRVKHKKSQGNLILEVPPLDVDVQTASVQGSSVGKHETLPVAITAGAVPEIAHFTEEVDFDAVEDPTISVDLGPRKMRPLQGSTKSVEF